MSRPRADRTESAIQILILLVIGIMAGAASFTHVHDWTMRNVPPGTGNWFGWANAVISELTPTAAGLEIRRRKRHNRPIAYPMAVLIAAAALSLSAQVAQARPSPTGWLLAAVPALAFLALTKLVLARADYSDNNAPAHDTTDSTASTEPAPGATTTGNLPSQLLTGARMAAFAHRQSTGSDITADSLATHLAITPDVAGSLIQALGDDGIPVATRQPVIAHANGTPTGSRQ